MQKKKECGRERRRDQNDMDRIARVKPTGQQPSPPHRLVSSLPCSLSLFLCVSLRAESNRSCEKSFQLMWQNGKARGRRKRRQPIRPEAAIFSPFPSFLLPLFGQMDTQVRGLTMKTQTCKQTYLLRLHTHTYYTQMSLGRLDLLLPPSLLDSCVKSVWS